MRKILSIALYLVFIGGILPVSIWAGEPPLVEDRSEGRDMEAEAEGYLFPEDVSGLASWCTDGTQLYLRETDNTLEARFYLFKDGYPVSYWRDADSRSSWGLYSVFCLKHAIVLEGEGGTSGQTYVLASHDGKPRLIHLEGVGTESIKTSAVKTTVRVYRDKNSDKTKEYTFVEPFSIAERYKNPKDTGDIWPDMKRSWYTLPLKEDTGQPLAMKATCYHDGIEVRAEAWRTGEGIARLRISINDTERTLSFLPTSGLCWKGKMILHGQKDGKPAAAVIENRKDGRKTGTDLSHEHIITTISEVDPATVPFVPYAGEAQ